MPIRAVALSVTSSISGELYGIMFWFMQDEVLRLFPELDDLTTEERRRYFEQHDVPADLQAELESLLRFDSPDKAMTEMVADAAQALLESLDVFP
jgi:hypothetical protein